MVNDDVLRKWINNNPTDENFDRRMHRFKSDILRIKLGFTGIGNRHFSLINSSMIKRGNKIIWDYYLDINNSKDCNEYIVSPKIFQIVSLASQGDDHTLGILLGIGNGSDKCDLVIGKTYKLDNLLLYPAILRLDSMGRYKSSDKRSY